jgi:NAD(P) transhydrogenase subunit beta
MTNVFIELAYLVSVCLFAFGMKALSSPRTARNGNLMASLAMLLAVVAALFQAGLSYGHIATGLVVGTALGAFMAARVQMTQMPEMVALLNGFGGLASMLVGLSEYGTESELFLARPDMMVVAISLALSVIIGAVTLTGSLIAWGKLNDNFKYIGSSPSPSRGRRPRTRRCWAAR